MHILLGRVGLPETNILFLGLMKKIMVG